MALLLVLENLVTSRVGFQHSAHLGKWHQEPKLFVCLAPPFTGLYVPCKVPGWDQSEADRQTDMWDRPGSQVLRPQLGLTRNVVSDLNPYYCSFYLPETLSLSGFPCH